MRRTISIAAILVLVAIAAHAQETEKKFLASDKKTEITIPASWDAMELNDAAEIQVGSEKDEAYLIVLNEAKEDLYGWNLEKHSRITLGKLLDGILYPTVTGPKSLTVNGHPAVQYEIRGASDNKNMVYIHTTIDGPKYLSQIVAWTLPSHLESVKPQLVKAINSFREVE